jgi:hypothetical protein
MGHPFAVDVGDTPKDLPNDGPNPPLIQPVVPQEEREEVPSRRQFCDDISKRESVTGAHSILGQLRTLTPASQTPP